MGDRHYAGDDAFVWDEDPTDVINACVRIKESKPMISTDISENMLVGLRIALIFDLS